MPLRLKNLKKFAVFIRPVLGPKNKPLSGITYDR
jgi:hypothetical protein